MFVLPISKVGSLDRLRTHEELKSELVEWQPGLGNVLFISHTWLGFSEPDPNQDKLQLLKALLRSLFAGKLHIAPHWTTESMYGSLSIHGKKIRKALRNGFIWLDYWSIPQAAEARELQRLAISSISTYVADCTYFCCLAGAWQHENGSVRDVRAWASRGWCRVEQLANALSPSVKPLIVATSPSSISTYGPGGIFGRPWLYETVGHGAFTVPSDAAALFQPLTSLIDARKAFALEQGDLVWYRVVQSCKAHLLSGLAAEKDLPPRLPLGEWMAAMRFESVHDERASGLTPLRFAVLAGRADLAEEILGLGVDVEARLATDFSCFEFLKGQSILQTACAVRDDPGLVRLLLRHGAQPAVTMTDPKLYALHFAAMYGRSENIDALINPQGGIQGEGSGGGTSLMSMCGSCPLRGDVPFAFCTYFGQRDAFNHLLQTYPEQMKPLLNSTNPVGLSLISNNLFAIGDCETLSASIAAGADVNQSGTPDGPQRNPRPWLYWVFSPLEVARLLFMSSRYGAGTEAYLYATRCTALHTACYMGNLGAVEILLGAAANLHSTSHPRGCQPLHLAALGGHERLIQVLLDAGAQRDAKDRRGRTPLAYARKAGQVECAALLRP